MSSPYLPSCVLPAPFLVLSAGTAFEESLGEGRKAPGRVFIL